MPMASKSLIATFAAVSCAFLAVGCTAGGSRPMAGSIEHCVQRAKLAMRDSDFTERFAVYPGLEETVVYGQHGGYRAHLHCIVDNPTIGVEVTGFDPAQTQRYKESIIKRL
jgi:hypothetical protein